MKKLIALLLLVCLLPLCALAETTEGDAVTVSLSGAEFVFTPAEGMYLLTRESSASAFNRLGLSQRDIVPSMEADSVYAILFDMELGAEFQIIANPTGERDFDELTDEELAQACEEIRSAYEFWEWQVETSEVYCAPEGHRYVKSVYYCVNEDGAVGYSAEYLTSQAGYELMVLMYPYQEGAPTAEQLAKCAAIADSLRVMEVALEGRWEEASADGIAVRFWLPEDVKYLTKNSSAEDWSGLPKSYAANRKKQLAWGDFQGLIMSPDAKWEIQWQLYDLGDNSDLDIVSDEDAEAFLEMYVSSYKESGYNVSYSACVRIGSHRYLHVRYNYATGGSLIHVEEHYTIQNGRGVLVNLIGYDEVAPEEANTLLQGILESQIIVAD